MIPRCFKSLAIKLLTAFVSVPIFPLKVCLAAVLAAILDAIASGVVSSLVATFKFSLESKMFLRFKFAITVLSKVFEFANAALTVASLITGNSDLVA